ILLAASVTTTGEGTANAAPQERLAYEPFTAARLTDLEAAGKPVFVNLTASWCLTCLINERVALDSDAVRQAFTAHGIVALKGDWTSQNPEITALLQQFGRSGVPLYLLYDGKDDPVILPQILTATSVTVDRATAIGAPSVAKPGAPAPVFGAPDIAGKTVNLGDYAGKIVILEWTNDGCPFVGKHYNSGNMQALQRRYTGEGDVWLTVAS